ncbi:hypothetical protein V1288_003836 [Bradyrhizobium sp. AZCC 2176]
MMTNPSTVIASEAKQSIGTANSVTVDCFVAEPVIGRRFAPTRWLLAMTEENPTGVIPGRAQARTRNLAQLPRGSGSVRFAARPERRP